MKIQQQGEVRIERIEALPEGLSPFTAKTPQGDYIVSHSESGHHHLLDGDCVDVMERELPPEFGAGMKVLYAIVKEPTAMRQSAAKPHETAPMEPGIYEMTISTEVDPFTKQARRVAD